MADLAVVPTPNAIRREGASRRIDVTCNVSTRDLGAVARDIEARIGKLTFVPGYHPEILGEYPERQAAQSRLGWLALASLLGILVLPLVLKGHVPGNEIERPVALVILGGLVTSTALDLFLLPALDARFAKRGRAHP